MERRPPKKTDLKQTQKCFDLIVQVMQKHPEIEPTLWGAAIWIVLVLEYKNSGMSYEQFSREWDELKHHYKPLFDQ